MGQNQNFSHHAANISTQRSKSSHPRTGKTSRWQKSEGTAERFAGLFRQLAVILQSGVPLAQGLTLIAEHDESNLSSCVQQIAARLSAGEELSLSLRNFPKVFEPHRWAD